MTHEPGSVCLFAPGDIVWKTDMEIIRMIYQGVSTDFTLETVAAKYLINVCQENN